MPTAEEAAVWLASLIGKTPEQLTADDWMHVICRANRLSEQGSMAFHLSAALIAYGDARAAEERKRCARLARAVGNGPSYGAQEHASGFAAADIVARIVRAIANADQPGV